MLDKPGAHGVKSPHEVDGVTHLLVVTVGDVDAHHARAAAAGAEILVPPTDRPWGRDYELRDGEGYVFSFFSKPRAAAGRGSSAVESCSRAGGSAMSTFIHNVTFDANDPRLLGRFWSQVTGYAVVDDRDEFVRLRAPDARGVRQILFLRVDDPTPGKNRVHVDLAAPQPQDEIERLVGLGASLADELVDGRPRWREGNGITWVVLRDPEGNEFCVGAIP
jgi:predicted enzyme related to lactoylglutathione lyase